MGSTYPLWGRKDGTRFGHMDETAPGTYGGYPAGQKGVCSLGSASMAKDTPRPPPGPQGVGAGIISNKWGANLTQNS